MTTERETVTVTESLAVARPQEVVFDYTQNYGSRSEWDRSVVETQVLGDSPRRIRLRVRGLGSFTVEYRLFRPPERTSAAFVDVTSAWITGGGGSWRYETSGQGTVWTQTNTLELKHPRLLRILAPLFERNLRSSMRRSMADAKRILESR
jgi:hypothetical protein